MSLKVTHIVRQYLPSIGGMEEVVRNIALHQLHHTTQNVRIITLDRLFRNHQEQLPTYEVIEGIAVTRLPYYGSSRYPLCPSILKALGDTDIIHVHGVDFFYDFLAATRWLHRRPLVLSSHGGFFHTNFASRAKLAYFNTISRLSATAFKKVIATSTNDGQLFSRIVNPKKLEIIENGVNVEKYADRAAETLQPTLIYFGRWSANKGLMETIDLFAQLHQRRSEWRLIIAGREYDYSLSELQTKIDNIGLTASITLAANPPDSEICQLLQQASYFICLSHHEGFGIAPIEGMSAGLTPVLNDIPPFRRLIEQSQLGFVIDKTMSIDAAITALLDLHDQGNQAYRIRRDKAMAFSQQYAWPKIAERYAAIYAQLGANQ